MKYRTPHVKDTWITATSTDGKARAVIVKIADSAVSLATGMSDAYAAKQESLICVGFVASTNQSNKSVGFVASMKPIY